jgi:hypothetical protein
MVARATLWRADPRSKRPGQRASHAIHSAAFVLTDDEAALVTGLASASAAIGELWFSYFEPATLEEHLRHCGSTGIVHFGPEEAEATPGDSSAPGPPPGGIAHASNRLVDC